MVTQASGGSRGGARGARLPLFLDETETRRAEKILGDPPLSMSLNDCPPPPPTSQGLDPALQADCYYKFKFLCVFI